MLTLLAIMMFTSWVVGGMRHSASFLDRDFSDCTFSVSSSSFGLRQPSLKGKKKKCLHVISHRIVWPYPCVTCLTIWGISCNSPFALTWADVRCLDVLYTPSLTGVFPVPALFYSVLVITGCLVITQLRFRQDIPPFSLSCICKLVRGYIYSLSGTTFQCSHSFPVALLGWCHPPLPFNRASLYEILMPCRLSRSSRFYLLVELSSIRSLSGHSFIFLES